MTLANEQQESIDAVVEATREITKHFDRSYWVSCIEEQKQPMEMLKALGDGGLLGLGVPEDLGGAGGGLREQVALLEHLGRAGIPGYSFLVANFVRATLISFGSQEQIDTHVPRTLTGETFTSFALTEPDSGTNSFALRTRAERDGDDWVINGQKCFITAFGEVSQAMIVARTSDASQPRAELSLFMIELPYEGVSYARQRVSAGAPDHQYTVFLDNVRVPASALVGEAGQGTTYLFAALNTERMLGAAMALGLGHFALHKGVEYAKVRSPFGKPIGAYQAVSHPLARAKIQLEASGAMLERALDELDEATGAASYLPSAAKLMGSEAANQALDATIQAYGGWAFDHDSDVSTLSETFRLFRVAPINNESVLNLVATSALGLPRSH